MLLPPVFFDLIQQFQPGFGRFILVIFYSIRIEMGTPEPIPDDRPGIGRKGISPYRIIMQDRKPQTDASLLNQVRIIDPPPCLASGSHFGSALCFLAAGFPGSPGSLPGRRQI